MSRVTPAQFNFNGGEISRRLHARHDLALHDIAMAEMTGFVALIEGGMEACPGTIRVAQAAGPCRLVPFEFSATQAYVIEMSAGKARFYTNDARIEVAGVPVELALPYSLAQIGALTWHRSYDVLYLFHRDVQSRELTRVDADSFAINLLELENGPFEARNKDESLIVSASGVSGSVTLTATDPIFEAGDVGGLFQIEADDFGDVSSWEPGITVTNGQLLTWNERVYRVVGGSSLRTGTVAPIHNEGVEWDGIGRGKDLNDKDAGGVQLEYLHDRFGVLRITGYTSATQVSATVLRRLPFTAATSYDYDGGYYDPIWGDYTPPPGAVAYQFGTWRWRFGSFSNRRGWPQAGVVWNERLVLAKDSTVYASVAGDLKNHATYNETGEISTDMAFQYVIEDPNGINHLIAQDRLLVLTRGGLFAIGPNNAANGVGPGNVRCDRQNNEGTAATPPTEIDGRNVYIGRSRRRVIEADYSVQRDRREPIDLSRYARHIGQPRFVELAGQKDPNRLIWAVRGDGSLAAAAYVPEEQVLGWARRELAPGMAARSITSITDPAGELTQIWIAAEFGGAWHVLRMDQFRQEDDPVDPVMLDMAAEYEGPPATVFGPVPWLAGRTADVWADDRAFLDVAVDASGMFAIEYPSGSVRVGLRYPARATTLPAGDGGDSGPAMDKMKRISRLSLNLLRARGLRVSVQGSEWRDIEQLLADSVPDAPFPPDTGIVLLDDTGTNDREGQITIERVAPFGSTVRAIQMTLEVQQR